jgi:membrane protease YdiL (CAAX protease family)
MSDQIIAYAPARRKSSMRAALTAGLEVTLVIGCSIAAVLLAQWLIPANLAAALGLTGGSPDLFSASWILLQQFAVQYGALLILVVAIGLWRRRTGLRSYALGRGDLSTRQLVRYGVLLGLVAGTPATALLMLQQYAPIGADTPMWAALRSAPKDLSFWTFMAVGSFALVPLVEEITWRGYVLGRFSEALGPGAAVVATAVPFALLHTQYVSADPAMMLATFSVLIISFATCFATIRTGTIWPAVIAHAIVNSPIEGALGWIRVAAIIAALLFFARPIASEARIWFSIIARRETLGAVLPILVTSLAAATLLLPAAQRGWLIAGFILAATVAIAADRSTSSHQADDPSQ